MRRSKTWLNHKGHNPNVLRLYCFLVFVVVVVVVVVDFVIVFDVVFCYCCPYCWCCCLGNMKGWSEVVVVCKPIFVSIPTQLRLVEVVLRLSWGCDNSYIFQWQQSCLKKMYYHSCENRMKATTMSALKLPQRWIKDDSRVSKGCILETWFGRELPKRQLPQKTNDHNTAISSRI